MQRRGVWVIAVSLLILVLGGCGIMSQQTSVEKFPNKPISVIVPFGPGGSSDLLARSFERTAMACLGHQVIVLNKPGGGAMIGWNELASAKPDGYTMGIATPSIFLPALYGPTQYHYATALEPLAQVVTSPYLLVVAADQPWTTLEELVDYAKEHPGKVKYCHGGIGTIGHVASEMFAMQAGIKVEQVPFQGGSEMIASLLGGHTEFMLAGPSVVQDHIRAGKMRVLAIADEKRLTAPMYAQIPTFRERGMDVVCNVWQGIAVPKGVPADVKAKLSDGIRTMVSDPAYIEYVKGLGMDVEYLGPKEFADKWLIESERLAKVVKEAGIAERIASQKN